MSGELIISIGYGIEVKPKDYPFIETLVAAVKPLWIAAVPGAFLVYSFPILR